MGAPDIPWALPEPCTCATPPGIVDGECDRHSPFPVAMRPNAIPGGLLTADVVPELQLWRVAR